MVCTYQLYLLNRHLFIDLPEGRTLVDTGAPFSSSTTGRLTWQNQNHGVNKGGYFGFTFDQLSAEIGVQVDALLGMDHLAQTTLLFDVTHRTLTAGDEMPAGFVARPYELAPMSDIPLFTVTLNGQPARVLWDTGAQYGYVLRREFAECGEDDGAIEDYNPIMGKIHSPAWRVPVDMHGVQFQERVGVLTGMFAGMLGMVGVDAIVGCSWMPSRRVWFMPEQASFAVA